MKGFRLLICTLLSFGSIYAQDTSDQMLVGQRAWRVPRLPLEDGQIVYKGDVPLAGHAKEQLYSTAYYWLKNNLKSNDTEMRIADRGKGRISGRGKILYNHSVLEKNGAQGIYFDYDIQLEDGSYAYRLSNFRGITSAGSMDYTAMYLEELDKIENAGHWTHQYRYEMLSDMNSFITLFISGLKANMVKQ